MLCDNCKFGKWTGGSVEYEGREIDRDGIICTYNSDNNAVLMEGKSMGTCPDYKAKREPLDRRYDAWGRIGE